MLAQSELLRERVQQAAETTQRFMEMSALLTQRMAANTAQAEQAVRDYMVAVQNALGSATGKATQADASEAVQGTPPVQGTRRRTLKELDTASTAEKRAEATSVPVWQRIKQIGSELPAEAWDKVPADLATNLDAHLYGR